MAVCTPRISLYWLDDHESYLGEASCTCPSTSWLPFAADTHGMLCLATAHIFFDDGGDTIIVFPLHHVEGATIQEAGEQLVLSFSCKRAFKREVLPCSGEQPAMPGVCVPLFNTRVWCFRVPRVSQEWFTETLRSVLLCQRTEELLTRREVLLQTAPSLISFRVRRQVPMREQRGVLQLTATHLVFQPLFCLASHSAVTLQRGECVHSFPRWVVFEAVGLDLYTSTALDHAPALSLLFGNTCERDQATELLQRFLGIPPYTVSLTGVAEAWKRRELTNYDYLLHLNKLSSRCFNDVFQYPVFPWVLSDYTSAELDLSASATFRDLGKPIGALSPDRLEMLRERAQFLDEAEERTYLYSTHYSSAGVVAYYLVRSHPEFQLCLQGGTLDVAERIMESIPQVWRSVTTNTSNFRELIPDFFNESFVALCGPPRLALGLHSSGRPVRPYVELPPWATNARNFVKRHREALESDYVSQHLHRWIDLIFGVAQNGEAARAADNLFHPFSYRQLPNKQVSVPGLHLSPHEYAREFGNVPIQLFRDAHPSRNDSEHGVRCTAEAGECGEADMSLHHRRLAEMMEALQSADEEAEEPPLRPDLSEAEDIRFATTPATLVEVASTTLACTSVRVVAFGLAAQASPKAATESSAILLLVGDDGRVVTLFSAASGERLRTFPDFDGQTTAVAHYAGNMYVFTDNRTCYAISLTSLSVTRSFAELTAAPVVHVYLSHVAVALADTEARVSWWGAATCTEAASQPLRSLNFDVPPSLTSEASSRVLCLGGATRSSTVVAISATHEAFLFHDDACEACTLRNVPAEAEVLSAATVERVLCFWVFFRSEALFYDSVGVSLERIVFPAATEVVCARLGEQLYPLCLYTGRFPVRVRVLQRRGENEVQLRRCRVASPCVTCSGAALAIVGPQTGEGASSLVLTVAELKAQVAT